MQGCTRPLLSLIDRPQSAELEYKACREADAHLAFLKIVVRDSLERVDRRMLREDQLDDLEAAVARCSRGLDGLGELLSRFLAAGTEKQKLEEAYDEALMYYIGDDLTDYSNAIRFFWRVGVLVLW